MTRPFSYLVLVAALLLVACQAPEPFASSILPTPETTSVPPTTLPAATEPTSGTTPVAQALGTLPASLYPGFRLDPLTPESTEATGQGPLGFTLVIVDATSGARILGTGRPDSEGNFRIQLNQPPAQGHLVGLTVDLTKEQLASEELMQKLFDIRGAGFRMIPQVVIVYDSYPVP
jgi:hypothetical protein